MKNPKLIIGIVVILILIIVLIVGLSSAKAASRNPNYIPNPNQPNQNNLTQQGLFETISGWFTPKQTSGAGASENPLCKIFPRLCPNPDCYNRTKDHVGCLSSKPGYNCKGEQDSYC